jgi:site-specific recombinase XerD
MPNPIPLLLTYLFGEAAAVALPGASPRLLLWAAAFDAWLQERLRRFKPVTVRHDRQTWQRLLGHIRVMPWELTQADIESHLDWLVAGGFAPATVYKTVGQVSGFYRWCSLHAVDPACPPDFNPAASLSPARPAVYSGLQLLSRGEVHRLLETLRSDVSPVGQRDYAFILARLRLGVPLHRLQNLRWGQLEVQESGAGVRWRAGGDPLPLPQEVWQALLRYLSAAGRLETMSPSACLFAPLRKATRQDIGDRAADWQADRPFTQQEPLYNLKRYGRLACLPAEKLTLQVLRLTAVRLQWDAGASLSEMRAFMDSRLDLRHIKYHLGKLPALPPDVGEVGQAVSLSLSGEVPSHKQALFQPGDGYKHGFFANSQPPEMVQAVLAENIQGIDEAFVGLRLLGRGLLERHAQAASASAMARLGDAYTLTASRLAGMLKTGNEMAQEKSGSQEKTAMLENFLDGAVRFEAGQGRPTTRQAVLAELEAQALGAGAELGLAAHRLEEEIASTRLILRNTLSLALQAGDADEYIHLVEIYSSGCSRLVHMLQRGHVGQDRLINYIREQILRAIDEVAKEMDLSV